MIYTIFQDFDSFAYALSWTVFHSIWQFLLIGIILRFLMWIVPSQHSELRYHLALATLLFGTFWWFSNFAQHFMEYQPTTISINEGAETSPISEVTTASVTTNTNSTPLDVAAKNPVTTQKSWYVTLKNDLLTFVSQHQTLLSLIWLGGVLFLGFQFIGSWWYLKGLRTKELSPIPKEIKELFLRLKEQLQISKNIHIALSAIVPEPITFGHFKPIILLPIGLVNQLSTEQVEAILLHELAHIQRNDFLINFLQTWTEILFFYHPIVWWINQQIRQVREECCDDAVLTNQNNQHTYAEALLRVEQFSLTTKINLTMNATGKKGQLTHRVHRLFNNPRTTTNKRTLSAPMLLLLLIISSLGFFAFQTIQSQRPTVSIAADKMNILYKGIENPITVAVEGTANDEVKLSSETIEFRKTNEGQYIAIPTKEGKATIDVITNTTKQTLSFKVKSIPDPITNTISKGNKYDGGLLTVEEVKQLTGIYAETLPDFDVNCDVEYFEITRVPAKQEDVVLRVNRTAVFNEHVRGLIDKAASGDVYYIEKVKTKCSGDTEAREINSIVFKVK